MANRNSFSVRSAVSQDLDTITRIYAHHVLNGTGSFEEEAPSLSDMTERFDSRESSGYPTLVAENAKGEVVGFAYAAAHKQRSAYRFTVEDTVYVDAESAGCGVGYALMTELIERCIALDYRQMMAVIGDSENQASIKLHEKLGFSRIGAAKGIGFKYGRWLDVVYMQLSLTAHSNATGS